MGKGQSKERFIFNIGRRKEREGPEGECFMVNTAQPSDEGISMCISREDLDKFSLCNEDQSLQVLLPSTEFEEKCEDQLKMGENLYSSSLRASHQHKNEKKDDSTSFIQLIVNDFDSLGNSTEKNVENFVKLIHSKISEKADKCTTCGNKSVNIKLLIAQDENDRVASPISKDASTPTKAHSLKKKKRICGFKLKHCFNRPKSESMDNPRLEKDAMNEKLKSDGHKNLSHSLGSSPTCMKYRDSIENLNTSLPVQFNNKLSPCIDPEIPFDIRDSGIPPEVTTQYLKDLVIKSFQENNHYYSRSKSQSRTRNRNTHGLECKDQRNHYLDLAGVEHCANTSHHNKTDDQLNHEIHQETEKQRSVPQRSHSYNAYDSQIQYKKLHSHKKVPKYWELDSSPLVPELRESKVRHFTKKQMCASKHIREINHLSPLANRKPFSNEIPQIKSFETHFPISHSNFSPDLAYKYKSRQQKHGSSHRTNRVDPMKTFQPIYESIEAHENVGLSTYGNIEEARFESRYGPCLPNGVLDSKICDSRNNAIKHSNCNYEPCSKCDKHRRYKQAHNQNEHSAKSPETNCCFGDKNRQSGCNKAHEKNSLPAKCLSEHLHCVQHVIHHHYHHYDLV